MIVRVRSTDDEAFRCEPGDAFTAGCMRRLTVDDAPLLRAHDPRMLAMTGFCLGDFEHSCDRAQSEA